MTSPFSTIWLTGAPTAGWWANIELPVIPPKFSVTASMPAPTLVLQAGLIEPPRMRASAKIPTVSMLVQWIIPAPVMSATATMPAPAAVYPITIVPPVMSATFTMPIALPEIGIHPKPQVIQVVIPRAATI